MSVKSLVAREAEIEQLENIVSSKRAEFVALYGRRRIGKTFLVREFAKVCKDIFFFDFSGQKDASKSMQIDNFCRRLEEVFDLKRPLKRPRDWSDALAYLKDFFSDIPKGKKIVIFLDELPWLAGRRSNFMETLDYTWNQYWSKDTRIKLIMCGSAASWMIKKIINAKGGLHNRITHRILLEGFRIHEVEKLLQMNGIRLKRSEILKVYMTIGGVPYYWSLISKAKSAAEIVQSLYFEKDGALCDEYERIFQSLFDHHHIHEKIVLLLSKKSSGLSREELLHELKKSSGGQFNKYLEELEESGFISRFIPVGRKIKDTYFKLSDEMCLFSLKWATEIKKGSSVWISLQNTSRWNAWAGHAFENFCFNHQKVMMKILKLENIVTQTSSWRYLPPRGKKSEKGAQIDLVWMRNDGVLEVFEMKYSENPFSLDKSYAKELQSKVDIFIENISHQGQCFVCLVSPFGLKKGLWNDEVVDKVVMLDDFF